MPVAAALACGLVAALFYLSVLTGATGSLILVYMVQLPLFGVGLALGAKAVVIAGAAATLVTAAAGGPVIGALFLLAELAPVVLLVGQALRRSRDGTPPHWYPAGRLALWLVVTGAVPLVAAALLLAGRADGFRGAVEGFLAGQLGTAFAAAGMPAADPGRAEQLAKLLVPYFPAMAVGSWLLMTAVNGVLAQGVLARFSLNRRPAPDIARLRLPRWLAGALVAAALLALFAPGDAGYLGRNLIPVIALGYVLAGIAVLHALARRFPARLAILIPAYLILMLGWPVLLLAACGILDQWFGLRRRFAAALPQGEE